MADSDAAAFDKLKVDIRSLVMAFQKGCTLQEFREEYRKFVGKFIPYDKYGYRDDVDLLYDIPDVVRIYEQGGTYILMAIANETTQHIQKMVSVQKPAPKKRSARYSKYQRSNRGSSSVSRSTYSSRPTTYASKPYGSSQSNSGSYPTSVVSKTSSLIKQAPLIRQAPVASNSTFASRPSPAASSPSPAFGKPPSASNSSFVGRLSPVASSPSPAFRQSPAASNSSFVSKTVPLSNDSSYSYSREFKKDLPPRFRPAAAPSTRLLPYDVECEIVDVVRKFSTGLRMTDLYKAYQRNYNRQFSCETHGFQNLYQCLETIQDLSMTPLKDDYVICYNGRKVLSSNTKSQENGLASEKPATGNLIDFDSCPDPSPAFEKDKAVEVFKFSGSWANHSMNGTPSENRLLGQSQNEWSFKQETDAYNFQDIPQVAEKSKYYQDNAVFKTMSTEEECRNFKSKADTLDSFDLRYEKSLGITENMRNKFRVIMSRNEHGIWAKEFPSVYEDVTGSKFDLHSLGFTDLAGLVDSVPDILRRKRVAGNRNDWIVIPAGGSSEEENTNATSDCLPKVGALLIGSCIQTISKLLQGISEGIPLNEFLHMYSINCLEPLNIADFGFDCIENFLLGIADQVPLKIEIEGSCKTVFLDETKVNEIVESPAAAILEENLPESIPYDAASPQCRYRTMELPQDIESSNYFPVYTSAILHPDFLYIQLQGPDTSEALCKLYDDIEEFYHGPYSREYQLQERHMQKGAMCAAFWPQDMHWYRAVIQSDESSEMVKVLYVDYGTADVIPCSMLRYLKEPYTKLPAQALKSKLAFLKPPKNTTGWSQECKNRMLELCQDVSLMAKVEEIKDGVLFLLLCDTNGKEGEEVHINDVLIKEGLAKYIFDSPEPQQQQQGAAFDPLMVVQAQCYWQTFNTLSLTMPPDDVAKAMQTLSLNYLNNPLVTRALEGTAAAYQGAAALPAPLLRVPAVTQQLPPVTNSARDSPVDESDDIFQDDDDLFEEFYQKSSSVSKRYCKRIRTGDGYFFHILIVDAELYVSSGDISMLIWSDKNPDYLLQRLQSRDTVFESRSIKEEGNEMMFDQIKRFHVKGIQKVGKRTCINIYPLEIAIAILNTYGHPSAELRHKILTEQESFNPQLPAWQEVSEGEIPDAEEEVFRAVTDDDKLNRLCIFDLMAMKDGIRIKGNTLRRQLEGEHSDPSTVDKLDKLECLLKRVVTRIGNIQQICTTFS